MLLPRPDKKQANSSAIDGLVLSRAAAHNQLNARWRSSVVVIDRKTRRYFFQGNIYQEKGTDPVFLENLSFDCDLKNSRAVKAEFDRFIQEIKEQEREALLKLR